MCVCVCVCVCARVCVLCFMPTPTVKCTCGTHPTHTCFTYTQPPPPSLYTVLTHTQHTHTPHTHTHTHTHTHYIYIHSLHSPTLRVHTCTSLPRTIWTRGQNTPFSLLYKLSLPCSVHFTCVDAYMEVCLLAIQAVLSKQMGLEQSVEVSLGCLRSRPCRPRE